MKSKNKFSRLICYKFGLLAPTLLLSSFGGVVHHSSQHEVKLINQAGEELDPDTPTIPDPDTKIEGSGDKKENKPERKPANLDELKKSIDNKMQASLREFVKQVQSLINQKISSIKNEKELSFEDRFNKTLYFSLVESFFTNHADEIVSDPSKYGIEIVYPYVVSNESQFNKGTIVFNNKTYEDKIWGNSAKTDYKKQVNGQGNSITPDKDKPKKENQTSDEEGAEILTNYFQSLKGDFEKIFLNEEDMPKVNTDYEIGSKVVQGFAGIISEAPKNFETWDEYIISKIRPRFIDFDLEQNKDPAQEDEQEQQQNVDNTLSPDIPIEGEQVSTDSRDVIENIPNLIPRVRYGFSTQKDDTLLTNFTRYNGKDNKSNHFFYFENPINTRFKYEVTGLTKSSIGRTNRVALVASIKITDSLQEGVTRQYAAAINTTGLSGSAQTKNEHNQRSYEAIQKEFLRFYKSVGLDEKLNYNDATKLHLSSNDIFQMVYLAVKAINQNKFKNELGQVNESIGYSENSAASYFLNYIRNLTVKNTNGTSNFYWNKLSQMYARTILILERDLNLNTQTNNKPKAANNQQQAAGSEALNAFLKENKISKQRFNLAFAEVKKLQLRLQATTRQVSGSPINHYNSLLKQVDELNEALKPFNLIRDKVLNKQSDATSPQDQRELENALRNLSSTIDNIIEQSKSKTDPFLIVLTFFLALISLSLYGFYFMQLLMNKTRQTNKINRSLSVTVLTIATIALIATALVALLIVGVF
ncbi:MSC_0620 family F1-like ATPase-associated subunit [Mycoplasma sp. E35C]|uniref:MSC_0620 family F1-like ATPase-associated subunit n=1 Tax=Mycoplasma sp. E35C TaxID=2801918 RepID=UPI001CA3F256|nr:hypothetical protein [Mycoplasma sp. E35C]QZX49121.1 hypothetical protein JJE79_03655 [Mycoplasma sp. E35C]